MEKASIIKVASIPVLVAGVAMIPFGYPVGLLWITIGILGLVTAKLTKKGQNEDN